MSVGGHHDLARVLRFFARNEIPAPATFDHVSKPRWIAANALWSGMSFEPEAGTCVLFPGYIMHEVEANRSGEDRIGLAFNVNFE